MTENEPFQMTRKMYLALKSQEYMNCGIMMALEAVASTAIEHPEWPPLDDKKTWNEWEAEYFGK